MNHGAIEVAQALSDPFSLTFAEIFLCYVQHHRRELRAFQRTAERLTAICAEHGFVYGSAHASVLRGVAMIEQGCGEEGLKQIQQGLPRYARPAQRSTVRNFFTGWRRHIALQANSTMRSILCTMRSRASRGT